MKTATPSVRKLTALLKKIGGTEPPPLPGSDDPVAVLIMSFLLWEATTDDAVAAYQRLTEQIVDYNDLRVCMPHEIIGVLGERYPQAADRAQRLRATLRDIYLREHDITLERLEKTGKRDLKKYVESLDGIVPYVAARLLLLCFDTHAVPVDERLRRCLIEADVSDDESDVAALAGWLTRQVKATAGVQVHFDLQAWSDQTGTRSARSRKKTDAGTKATGARKTAGKPAARNRTAKKSTTGRKSKR